MFTLIEFRLLRLSFLSRLLSEGFDMCCLESPRSAPSFREDVMLARGENSRAKVEK